MPPARVRSTFIASATALGWLKPKPEITRNSGTSTPQTPPKPLSASASSTPAAARLIHSAMGSSRVEGMRRASRAFTCPARISPTALAPKTQPKRAAGMWNTSITTRGAAVM